LQKEKENGYWKGICGTVIKTAYARTVPQRIDGRESGRKAFAKKEMKGYWEGICGTGMKREREDGLDTGSG